MTGKERKMLKSFANLCVKIGAAVSDLRRSGEPLIASRRDGLEETAINLEAALAHFTEEAENLNEGTT